MMTTTIRTTAFAAAVLVCASAATASRAQEIHADAPGVDQAQLLANINATMDETQDTFLVSLTSKASADLDQRFAKIDNDLFAPNEDVDALQADLIKANTETHNVFERLVMSQATYDMSAKIANIENPYEPHLPMAPFLIAFTIHD